MARNSSPGIASPETRVPPVGRRRFAAGLVVLGVLSAALAACGSSTQDGSQPPQPDRLRIGLVGAVAVEVFDPDGRGAGCGLADPVAGEIPGAECELEPVCPPVVATVAEIPAGWYRVRLTNVLDREVRVHVEFLDLVGEGVSRRLSYRLELAGDSQAALTYETGSSLEVEEGGGRVELTTLDTGSRHLALPTAVQELCRAVEEEAEELTEEEVYRRMLRLLPPSLRREVESERRQRAFLQAAASGEVETVRELLEEGATVDARVLLRAVTGGHREVVAILLDAGGDANQRGPRGETPLAAAFQADRPTVAELLLERGAEPDGRLLVQAVVAGRMDWVEFLRRFETPIDAKALVGHVRRGLGGKDDGEAPGPEAGRAFDFLLAEDLWRPFEWQLLDRTLCRDDPSFARRLLEAGADLDVRSPESNVFGQGRTPLHHAVLDGRVACVERLLEWGADVDAAGPRGDTPLLSAVRNQRLDLVEILLGAGAGPGRPDDAGTTPLLAVAGADVANVSGARRDAFLERQRALADLLLEAGADVDDRDGRGSNALVLASHAGNLPMVEHLLDREASLTPEIWEAMASALDHEGWRIQLERLWRDRDLPVPGLVELFPVHPAGTADARAQRRTLRDLRLVGTAVVAWATDHVAAASAPASWSVADYRPISAGELEELLAPHYLAWVPREDGWGHPIEYRLNRGDPLGARLILIRSPGRDGRFSALEYRPGPFPEDAYDEDVVWVDGRFLRWPSEAGSPGESMPRPGGSTR